MNTRETPAPAAGRRRLDPRRDLVPLAAILFVGLLARGLYLAELVHQPGFAAPGRDALYHDYWARAITTGDWAPPAGLPDPHIRTNPYLRPPGYPYFLAAIYVLSGGSYLAARMAQMLLGLASAVLAFLLGRRLFGRIAGMVAAAGMALFWAFPYYEGQLHDPALSVFLVLALGWALDLAARRPTAARAAAAGALLGALALVRPNALLFAPAALAWLLWAARRRGLRPLAPAVALTLAASLVVAPVTIRNLVAGDDLVLVSSNAGINLYLANNPQTDGVTLRIPEIRELSGRSGWTCFDYPAIVRGVERIVGRPLEPSQVSAYFARKGWAFIRRHPATALLWASRRAALFWGPAEVSNDEVVAYDRASSPVLRHLPESFPAVAALGLVGMALAFAGRRHPSDETETPGAGETAVALALFVLAWFASILPAPAAARYRVPVLPFLLVFAGLTAARLAAAVAGREPRRAVLPAASAVALFLVLGHPWVPYRPDRGAWHFNRAVALQHRGDLSGAEAEYREALADDPGDADAHTNLGTLLEERGELEPAIEEHRAALRLRPDFPEAENNLGAALLRRGDPGDAAEHLRRALALDPDYPEAHNNLALVLTARGEAKAAEAELRAALAARPGYGNAHRHLADLLLARGDTDGAVGHYRQALAADGGDARAEAGLGRALAARGDTADALSSLRRAVELDPGDVGARNDLARALAASGDLDGALAELGRARAADPSSAEVENNLGSVWAQKGDLGRAEGHFHRAVELDPVYPEARLNLATALVREGRPAEALPHYEKAIALHPGWRRAENDLAWLLATARQRSLRDPVRAVELAGRACRGEGAGNPGYLATLATAYAAAGRRSEALAAAKRAAAAARAAGDEATAREIERRFGTGG